MAAVDDVDEAVELYHLALGESSSKGTLNP